MTREEAINEIKSWAIPSKNGREVLETLIPELAESEDERIRKSLIKFLTAIKVISKSGRTTWAVRKEDAEMCKSFIAWLEKQKEQKPAENHTLEFEKAKGSRLVLQRQRRLHNEEAYYRH